MEPDPLPPTKMAAVLSTPSAASSLSTPASPHESSTAYEIICGICFTEIHPVDNPRGRLNSCNHLFCSYCIKEWAKNTNVCPSCKARFTRIYAFNPATQEEEETKVRRRNYKAWEETYYDDEDDEEEWEDAPRRSHESQELVACAICHQANNAARMIFCDRRQCPYAAHLDCLGLAERPLTFLCPQCTELREKEGETETSVVEAVPVEVPIPPAAAAAAAAAARRMAATRNTGTARSRPTSRSTAAGNTPATVTRRAAESRTAAPSRATASASSACVTPVAPSAAPLALYGGSRSTSTSSSTSSSSSSSEPSRTRFAFAAPSTAAPRRPIDFSKPHIPLASRASLTPVVTTTRMRRDPTSVLGGMHSGGAEQSGDGNDKEEDDLYFLAPTSHAVAATIELKRAKATRAADAQTRRQRDRARAERIGHLFGGPVSSGRSLPPSSASSPLSGQKRLQQSASEDVAAELDAAEKEFADPQLRRAMEERMVRRWAADILPVLRRRRYIDGDTVTSEADMWAVATAQARKMVREKLDAKGLSLRRRREQLVRAQANRESAALAKLARIIAQHREREQQRQPPLK